MKGLDKRVSALEDRVFEHPFRMVWVDDGQTEEQAIEAYGRDRIGVNDKLILMSWDGGSDATA
jgi:hypothetical protein